MTEKEKATQGLLYNPAHDPELKAELLHCKEQLFRFNGTAPSFLSERKAILSDLFGHLGNRTLILSPFFCDYGYNISIGDDCFANMNLVILDCAPVTIGNHVLIGPNVGIYTATHPFDAATRREGWERALPVTIGDDVWIGAQCCILPGVTIGAGAVIGAGSVVTRDIPAGMLAYGNPCRVIRPVE
ncbi:sugar O-acetyltransferase [Porphyromonas loveana]|uniref:sugar O-acetyltransferase n=1 Tax=Porphyromonas loveana TaxID=1884669 RepID=UPI0035A02C9C